MLSCALRCRTLAQTAAHPALDRAVRSEEKANICVGANDI